MVLNLMDVDDEELRARITVFGVGGAGGNAVNNMIEKKLAGVEFIAANTDAQALGNSRAERRIQLGQGVTRGLGAGSKPDVGMSAAEESIDEIAQNLEGAHMCFITGGMGGGTGTGAAPVVARIAREMGILTVGVVTKPFQFEGARRMKLAEAGVEEMQRFVDTLIVIPNQNLFQVASERTTFVEAFQLADDVLYQGVQGVTDLMVRPGMINLDFADVRSVMEEMGKAMMGTGEADGDTRAIDAAEKAIANPLLDEVSLKGAKGVLINITGGYDLTLFEMDEAANRIKDEVDPNALIKFGSAIDPDMEGKMRVSVVATGIDAEVMERTPEDEAPMRRKPAMTDPTGILAVRGGRGRPEARPEARPETRAETRVEEAEDAPAPAPVAEYDARTAETGGNGLTRAFTRQPARPAAPAPAPAEPEPVAPPSRERQ
ncbi:MAG: cell division protein FtsZ, partial [Pseudomonadota bacterium]